jgi:hypothetical protein
LFNKQEAEADPKKGEENPNLGVLFSLELPHPSGLPSMAFALNAVHLPATVGERCNTKVFGVRSIC